MSIQKSFVFAYWPDSFNIYTNFLFIIESDCADCALSLLDTVVDCISQTDTTEGIILCVEEAIGTADLCFPCICDVLAFFDVICPTKL